MHQTAFIELPAKTSARQPVYRNQPIDHHVWIPYTWYTARGYWIRHGEFVSREAAENFAKRTCTQLRGHTHHCIMEVPIQMAPATQAEKARRRND